MQVLIHWNIFANVNSEQKCRKVITSIEKALGSNFANLKIEKYWKDKHLFKVQAISKIDVRSDRDGFFDIMTKAGHLSRSWSISTPSENSPLEFGGASQPGSGIIPGIDSVAFDVARSDSPDVLANLM
jgi:hypothetical protein